jgi:NADH:ubiquinone oxidoreductase subunit F (NADH-binding)
MLGAGGVIGLSQDTNVLEVVRKLSEYNAKESCGKCTPCREGTTRLLELMANDSGDDAIDWNGIGQLAEVINAASLCGLGQAAGNPVLSYGSYFQEVSPGSQGGGI